VSDRPVSRVITCGANNLNSASHHFDIVSFFGLYVKEWLNTTDNRTGQWVQTAIVVDKVRTIFSDITNGVLPDHYASLNRLETNVTALPLSIYSTLLILLSTSCSI
jgi:hypothetical protein